MPANFVSRNDAGLSGVNEGMELKKPSRTDSLAWRLTQAYIWLAIAPANPDGSRTAEIARYGVYEIRLIEPAATSDADAISFWIELYDHKNKLVIDSCGGHEVDDVAAIAQELILLAERLHAGSGEA